MAKVQRPLHEVILNFHNPNGNTEEDFLQCENKFDKIYGLISLVIPEQRIQVDYAASEEMAILRISSQVVKNLPGNAPEGKQLDTLLKIAENTIWASCNALGVSWPQSLSLDQEWAKHSRKRWTFTDTARKQVQGMYSWFYPF